LVQVTLAIPTYKSHWQYQTPCIIFICS